MKQDIKIFKDIHLDNFGMVYVFPSKVYNRVFSLLSQMDVETLSFFLKGKENHRYASYLSRIDSSCNSSSTIKEYVITSN